MSVHRLAPASLSLALLLPATALADNPPDCATVAPPTAPAVTVDDECYLDYGIGRWDPRVEWEWIWNYHTSWPINVLSTPVVAHLTDDDGDGVFGPGDVPDIVFLEGFYYYYGPYADTKAETGPEWDGEPVVLTVLSGDGSRMHWSTGSVDGEWFSSDGGVAVADLDGDGSPEICATMDGGEGGYDSKAAAVGSPVVGCVHADGSDAFVGYADDYYYDDTRPVIGDMDNDGSGEVVMGDLVFDATGVLVGDGAEGGVENYAGTSFLVDLDADDQLELVTGSMAYEMDGTPVSGWPNKDAPWANGAPVAADVDGDDLPEVIYFTYGYGGPTKSSTSGPTLVVLEHDGSVKTEVEVADYGYGPPLVADVNGDGTPEIGTAGCYEYVMVEVDGTELWSHYFSDYYYCGGSSAAADLDGDGLLEVVTNDYGYLYILDGLAGWELYDDWRPEFPGDGVMPVIADVDADGSTEIVVPNSMSYYYDASGDKAGSRPLLGMAVYGSKSSTWMPTRQVWNQSTYHVTNVEDDGGLPAPEPAHFTANNTVHVAETAEVLYADLVIDEPTVCVDDCSVAEVDVYLPVLNQGLGDAGDFDVVVYCLDDGGYTPVSGAASTTTLASGEASVLGPYTITEAEWGDCRLIAMIDDGGDVEECDEENSWWLGYWPAPDYDTDLDGHVSEDCGGDDCDDADPAINPDMADEPGDSIDSNCDGADGVAACDVDEDGYESLVCGGDDCDDSDDTIYPGADDIPEDGIDQDCDGADDCTSPPWVAGGFGCSSVPAPTLAWVFAPLLALLGRRRRS